jgi:tryptophan-rich sensory protein/cytochrome c553
MKKILRWLGFGVLGVLTLLLVGATTLYSLGTRKVSRIYTVQGQAITVEVTDEVLARGEHLVRFVSGCADCHGANLGGNLFVDEPGFAKIYAPNLTAGQGGAASVYSDADWERALRKGIGHEGRALAPMMPSEAAQHFSDADLAAIVAYIRSVPPIDGATPKPNYALVAKMLIGAGVLPLSPDLVVKVKRLEPSPEIGVTTEYGHYLANIAGCTTCHGANLTGAEHPAHPGLQTPNLSSGNAASWSLEEFQRTLRTGRTPEGKDLSLELMPWAMYAGMTDDEMEAMWLWLESLEVESRVNQRLLMMVNLFIVLGICVVIAVLGNTFVGEGLKWFNALAKPKVFPPMKLLYVVGIVVYIIDAVILYRALSVIQEGRALVFALTLVVMVANELWNYLFFGLRSTFAGFMGIAVFLLPLTALQIALFRYDPFSAWLLLLYYAWVLYDLVWTFALWRLHRKKRHHV